MRVSEFQIYALVLNNLQRARAQQLELQEQISTGKRVSRASDDPVAFNRIASSRTAMAIADQRLRNIQLGTTRLRSTDTTLASVSTVLMRLKELAVQLRDDANGPAERETQEIRQLVLQLQQLANTKVGGQALFGGTSTHGRVTGLAITAPVTLTEGVNDTLVVRVDGVTSGTIDLTSSVLGESLTGSQLASRLQSKINSDPTLSADGKSVTVTFDTDHLVITSNSSGATSSVQIVSGSSLVTLGLHGGSVTSGAEPFALQAFASASRHNTGNGSISQGRVRDSNRVTLDDYLIKFSSPTAFSVYNVSTPVVVSASPQNTGGAQRVDAGVVDPTQVTLHNYEVRFKNIYTVTTGTNDGIRFDPGTGAVTATIAAGAYTGEQLASQIKTAMEAVSSGKTYTVTFDQASGKFTITNDAANGTSLNLLFANVASTARSLMGFSATDQAGIASGSSVTSETDTTGAVGVTNQMNIFDTTVSTNVFNITSSNNTLVMNDDGGADKVITLTPGSYTGAQLAAELASKLNASRDAANPNAYTVAYESVMSRRFTINNPAGNTNPLILKFADSRSTAAQILGSTPVTVTESVGASATTLNSDAGNATYLSGGNIDFDGIRVVLKDGSAAPRGGDVFLVSQVSQTVLANQTYTPGSSISFDGLEVVVTGAAPTAGDRFYVKTGVQYQGDSGQQVIEVGENQTVKTNLPGNEVFSGPQVDLFASLKALSAAIKSGYGAGMDQGLADLERAFDQVLRAQGEAGALSNRLESNKTQLEDVKVLMETILASEEEVDLVKAISDLVQRQTMIQATAQAAAGIFETSLLKFLR